MKLKWEKSTWNAYTADVIPGIGVEVRRPQSWKRNGLKKPWKVTVFGNHFLAMAGFEKLEDAQVRAEGLATNLVERMARKLGIIESASVEEVSP